MPYLNMLSLSPKLRIKDPVLKIALTALLKALGIWNRFEEMIQGAIGNCSSLKRAQYGMIYRGPKSN